MLIKTTNTNKQLIQRQVERPSLLAHIEASLDKRRQSDDGVWIPLDIRSRWDAAIENQVEAFIAYLHINTFGKRQLVSEGYKITVGESVEALEPRTQLQKANEAIELIRRSITLTYDEQLEAYLAVIDSAAPRLPLSAPIRQEMESLAEQMRKAKSITDNKERWDVEGNLAAQFSGGSRKVPIGLHRRFHEDIGTYKEKTSYM